MRIAIYKDSLTTGRGADRAVKNFAAAMSARGHDAVLFERGCLAERLRESWDVVVATGSNEAMDLDGLGYFERPGRELARARRRFARTAWIAAIAVAATVLMLLSAILP